MKKVWTTLAVAAALFVAYLYVRHQGVQMERQRHEADSLRTALAVVKAQSDSALHILDSMRVTQQASLARIGNQQRVIDATRRAAASLRDSLAVKLDSAQRVVLDSLEAQHRATEAVIVAQRDTALFLFRQASSERDTLAALLRASQAQTVALSVALTRAQRVPFWSRPSVRIGMLAGAFLLGHYTK